MPDLNVWLALSWVNHKHSAAAWNWFSGLGDDGFFFCRITQIGLLRLLTTEGIMGDEVLTIGAAWKVYDRWLEDSRVAIRHEPADINAAFRAAMQPVIRLAAPKAIGDSYLLAASQTMGATLVTFDKALALAGRKAGSPVVLLKPPSN